jgi:hypothetical protein
VVAISAIAKRCRDDNVCDGSSVSFDASGGDFRYYPERRHSPALQQVTFWGGGFN